MIQQRSFLFLLVFFFSFAVSFAFAEFWLTFVDPNSFTTGREFLISYILGFIVTTPIVFLAAFLKNKNRFLKFHYDALNSGFVFGKGIFGLELPYQEIHNIAVTQSRYGKKENLYTFSFDALGNYPTINLNLALLALRARTLNKITIQIGGLSRESAYELKKLVEEKKNASLPTNPLPVSEYKFNYSQQIFSN